MTWNGTLWKLTVEPFDFDLDLNWKHSKPFADSFSNPTGESGEVIYK